MTPLQCCTCSKTFGVEPEACMSLGINFGYATCPYCKNQLVVRKAASGEMESAPFMSKTGHDWKNEAEPKPA